MIEASVTLTGVQKGLGTYQFLVLPRVGERFMVRDPEEDFEMLNVIVVEVRHSAWPKGGDSHDQIVPLGVNLLVRVA